MNITDVRIRKVDKEGKMKAVVSITIDNEFAVHDIKIIEGEKGAFIAMPSRKNADGEYRDVAHPINSETRRQIQELIMQKYRCRNCGSINTCGILLSATAQKGESCIAGFFFLICISSKSKRM